MILVERADELVTLELGPYGILELGEDKGGAARVDLLVELEEHVGSRGVNVRDRLGRDHDPARLRLAAREPADLVAEGPRVREQQGRVEAEDHKPGELLRIGVEAPVVMALASRRHARGWSGRATRPGGIR